MANRRASHGTHKGGTFYFSVDETGGGEFMCSMPRIARASAGGICYPVLHRGNGRAEVFHKPGDYWAFESFLEETRVPWPARICASVLMPNHWHLELWQREDGELASFMQMLTTRHARQWQLHGGKVGYGHGYPSRY